MYKIKKTFIICGAHRLHLDYESKCNNFHGHNWKITVFIKSKKLNHNGMIMDFAHIKKLIDSKYDHENLNEVVAKDVQELIQTTAENMCKRFCDEINRELKFNNPDAVCYKIQIEEIDGSVAEYEEEEK